MSSSKDDALKKFWQLPELIESLLAYLDARSILDLTKAHPPTIQLFKSRSKMRSKMWKGFVDEIGGTGWDEESSILHRSNALLQMIGVPESLLLDLLRGVIWKLEK